MAGASDHPSHRLGFRVRRLTALFSVGIAVPVLSLVIAQAASTNVYVGLGAAAVEAPPVALLSVQWMVDPSAPEFLEQVELQVQKTAGPTTSFDLYLVPEDAGGNALAPMQGTSETLANLPVGATFVFSGQGVGITEIEKVTVVACYHSSPTSLSDRICARL